MASAKRTTMSLYKSLLRESKKLNSYNFRMYALDKIRHDFRANKNVTEPAQLDALLKKARENLDVIKRQAVIGHMYGEGHLVIENRPSQSQSTT